MWFTSDNAGPAHPKVLDALGRANEGYAPSYGGDAIMDGVRARIREIFEAPEAAVYLVATGTAANVLGLATLVPPWGIAYCHRNAHLEDDECGAPEFYTGGARLSLVDGPHGKIDPAKLEAVFGKVLREVHRMQPAALALTQATEAGTVYTLAELRALTDQAKALGVPVHMDGARFTNALVSLGCTPAEMTWKSGVDVLSFGGTKNGLMAVEAVVIFDPARAWEFELRRKRGAHLFSKHRYLSAQMQAYLEDDLWLDMARAANARAATLAEGLKAAPGAELWHPVDANMLFAEMPRVTHRALHAAGAHYYFADRNATVDGPDEDRLACRLVTNWSTTEEEVEAFLSALKG